MKAARIIIAFTVLCFTLTAGMKKLDSFQQCRDNMIFVQGGVFYAGSTKTESEYNKKICEMTVGNCYDSWFDVEMPRRAVHITSFCIDKYEFPNEHGQYPSTALSYGEAVNACEKRKKRLCTDTEWEMACMSGGVEQTWSYGYQYKTGTCNDDASGVLPSGYKRDCRTLNGIYDMNGNVAEWVDARMDRNEGGRVISYLTLKGGSYRDRAVFSRCRSVNHQVPSNGYAEFGARCCDKSNLERARQGKSPAR